jgi:hypothetical protein
MLHNYRKIYEQGVLYLVFPRNGPSDKSYKPPLVGCPKLSKTVGLTIFFTEILSTSSVVKNPKLTDVISVPIGVDIFIFFIHCLLFVF